MDFAEAWQEADNLIENGMTDDEVGHINELIRLAREQYERDRTGMFLFLEDMDAETQERARETIESFGFHCFVAGRIFQAEEQGKRPVQVEMTVEQLARYTAFLTERLAEAEDDS